MRLLTCTGCKFSGDCEHARYLRGALKGHGLRSVKFACARRENLFQPGQAAILTTYISTGDDMDNYMPVSYPGVVIEQIGGKVLGFIRPGEIDSTRCYPFEPRGNGYVKMPLARVRADESRAAVDLKKCRWCASFFALDGRCDRDPSYTPRDDCLAAQQQMEADRG